MTAPDRPEPICGPSCDPMICHAGHCALEQSAASNRHDLTDRLRDVIHAATLGCVEYHAADCRPCTARASLVMRLAVQPSQLPASPTAGSGNLADLIAEAIAAEHHRRAQARIEASPEQHAAGFADAAMAVVQPALDELTMTAKVNGALYRSAEADVTELTDQLRRTRIELDHWRTVITAELRAEGDQLREQLRQARADLGRYDHYAVQIGAKELDT